METANAIIKLETEKAELQRKLEESELKMQENQTQTEQLICKQTDDIKKLKSAKDNVIGMQQQQHVNTYKKIHFFFFFFFIRCVCAICLVFPIVTPFFLFDIFFFF